MKSLLRIFLFLSLSFSSFASDSIVTLIKNGKIKEIVKKDRDSLEFLERDKLGRNALALAILYKQKEIAKFLIENKIGLEVRDYFGRTPLMMAVTNSENLPLMSLLVRSGASPVLKDSRGRDILYYVKKAKSKEVLSLISTYRASIAKPSSSEITKYEKSVLNGNYEEIVKFFNTYKTLNYFKNDKENILAPLLRTDFFNKFALKNLVNLALDVNDLGKSKNPVLIEAIKLKKYTFCEQLIDLKARVDKSTKEGLTVLIAAVKAQAPVSLIQRIIEKSISLSKRDALGNTALHYVAKLGMKDVLTSLISNGHQLSIPNNKGETPIMSAINNSHEDIVKDLLKRPNLNISASDASGKDVVMYIASKFPVIYISNKRDFARRGYNFDRVDLNGSSADNFYSNSPNRPVHSNPLTPDDVNTGDLPDLDDGQTSDNSPSDDQDFIDTPYDSDDFDAKGIVLDQNLEEFIQRLLTSFIQKQKKNNEDLLFKQYLVLSRDDNHNDDRDIFKELNLQLKKLEDQKKNIVDNILVLKQKSSSARFELQKIKGKYANYKGRYASLRGQLSQQAKDLAQARNNHITLINDIAADMKEINDQKATLEHMITLLKRQEGELGEAKKEITNKIKVSETDHNHNLSRLKQKLDMNTSRANIDVEEEKNALNSIDYKLREFRNEKSRLESALNLQKKKRDKNLSDANSDWHKPDHVPETCQFLKDYRVAKAEVEKLTPRFNRVKNDVKSYEARFKRQQQIVANAANIAQQKINKLKNQYYSDVKKEKASYQALIADLKAELSIIEDEIQVELQALKEQLGAIVARVKNSYGEPLALEREWGKLYAATRLLAAKKPANEKFLCNITNGVVLYCLLKEAPDFSKIEGLNQDFIDKVKGRFDSTISAYAKYYGTLNKLDSVEWELKKYHRQMNEVEGIDKTIQTEQEKEENLEKKIAALKEKIAKSKDDINRSANNSETKAEYSILRDLLKLEEGIILNEMYPPYYGGMLIERRASYARTLAKAKGDIFPKKFYEKLVSTSIVEQRITNIDIIPVKIQTINSYEIKETTNDITKSEKYSFLNKWYDLIKTLYRDYDGENFKSILAKDIFVQGLIEKISVSRVSGNGKSSYIIQTKDAKYLIDELGYANVYKLEKDPLDIELTSSGVIRAKLENFLESFKRKVGSHYEKLNAKERYEIQYILNLIKQADRIQDVQTAESILEYATIAAESVAIASGAGLTVKILIALPECSTEIYNHIIVPDKYSMTKLAYFVKGCILNVFNLDKIPLKGPLEAGLKKLLGKIAKTMQFAEKYPAKKIEAYENLILGLVGLLDEEILYSIEEKVKFNIRTYLRETLSKIVLNTEKISLDYLESDRHFGGYYYASEDDELNILKVNLPFKIFKLSTKKRSIYSLIHPRVLKDHRQLSIYLFDKSEVLKNQEIKVELIQLKRGMKLEQLRKAPHLILDYIVP